MLKQGLAKTIVKMLSDHNMEKQQCASGILISLVEHSELIAMENNGVLTFCKGDARGEMLEQGILKVLVNLLSDNNTVKQQGALGILISLVEHGELIAI